jgi:uncharacterized protein YqhQ
MENTIANIRILDVVRLVHGYFIFVFLGLLLSEISNETFLSKFTKNHTRTVKRLFFYCTNAKVHEMTKMLYKCANNLFLMNCASTAKIV